jgi:hypothetical protein
MEKKHPLLYQATEYGCWPTTVLNSFIFLKGRNEGITTDLHRKLYSLLTPGGVASDSGWEDVLEDTASTLSFSVEIYKKNSALKVDTVNFNHAAVISVTANGEHIILLNGKRGNWYYGFDPDWDSISTIKNKLAALRLSPTLQALLQGALICECIKIFYSIPQKKVTMRIALQWGLIVIGAFRSLEGINQLCAMCVQ